MESGRAVFSGGSQRPAKSRVLSIFGRSQRRAAYSAKSCGLSPPVAAARRPSAAVSRAIWRLASVLRPGAADCHLAATIRQKSSLCRPGRSRQRRELAKGRSLWLRLCFFIAALRPGDCVKGAKSEASMVAARAVDTARIVCNLLGKGGSFSAADRSRRSGARAASSPSPGGGYGLPACGHPPPPASGKRRDAARFVPLWGLTGNILPKNFCGSLFCCTFANRKNV